MTRRDEWPDDEIEREVNAQLNQQRFGRPTWAQRLPLIVPMQPDFECTSDMDEDMEP